MDYTNDNEFKANEIEEGQHKYLTSKNLRNYVDYLATEYAEYNTTKPLIRVIRSWITRETKAVFNPDWVETKVLRHAITKWETKYCGIHCGELLAQLTRWVNYTTVECYEQ